MNPFSRSSLRLATLACLGGHLSILGVAAEQSDATPQPTPNPSAVTASASLVSCEDEAEIGAAYLRERPSDEGVKEVDITLRVWQGISPGKHAVHIHQTAKCKPCSAAGGHFDPGPNSNTSPDGNHPFHAGDLVNINVNDQGHGLLVAVTSRVSLSAGPLSLFDDDGSAFIIHVGADTYCPGGEAAGCAGGARAACGIIVRDD